MSEIKQWDETYVADTYARFPVCLTKGSGAQLWDEDGKSYIDMGSGIGVSTFGISDEVWVKAVTEQLTQLTHTSNLYYTKPCAELAKMLCEKTGMKKVFFANSGAEANECAIKAARKYAAKTLGEDHFYIITLEGSFHGRTITTLAATGQDVFHEQFQPLTPGFVYAKPGDLRHMEELLDKYPCAAVMLEPVQGEGGVCALDFDYLRGVQQAAHRHGALLIVDEVQCGNGRTGTLYAYEQSGLSPDIVTTAKGLGGGLPIGAVLFAEKTANVYTKGDHGSTFGGNPVCCAGAVSVLQRLDEAFLESVRKKAEFIRKELENAPGILSVSGLGLMIGLETQKDAAQVIAECREQGMLVLKAKNKVRLLPPLNIPQEQLEKAVQVLKNACAPTTM